MNIVIQAVKVCVGLANSLSSTVGSLVAWLFYVLIAIMTLEVGARYIFDTSIIWVADTSLWLYSLIFMLGGAYVLLQKKHASSDIFYIRLSPRRKAAVDVIGYLVMLLPLLIVVLPVAVDRVIMSQEFAERSTLTLWRPLLWPFRAIIPVALGLMLVQGVSEFLVRLVFLINPDIQLHTANKGEKKEGSSGGVSP